MKSTDVAVDLLFYFCFDLVPEHFGSANSNHSAKNNRRKSRENLLKKRLTCKFLSIYLSHPEYESDLFIDNQKNVANNVAAIIVS